MRLSELMSREAINIVDGTRLGAVRDSDLIINPLTGEIEALILPNRYGLLRFLGETPEVTVPWTAIRRVGAETLLVEVSDSFHALPRRS